MKNKVFISFGPGAIFTYIMMVLPIILFILFTIEGYWQLLFVSPLPSYILYCFLNHFISCAVFKKTSLLVLPSISIIDPIQHKIDVLYDEIVIIEISYTYGQSTSGDKIYDMRLQSELLVFKLYMSKGNIETICMIGYLKDQSIQMLKEFQKRNPEILIDDKINFLKK